MLEADEVQFLRYEVKSGQMVAVFRFIAEEKSYNDGLFWLNKENTQVRLHNLRASNKPHEITQFAVDAFP